MTVNLHPMDQKRRMRSYRGRISEILKLPGKRVDSFSMRVWPMLLSGDGGGQSGVRYSFVPIPGTEQIPLGF